MKKLGVIILIILSVFGTLLVTRSYNFQKEKIEKIKDRPLFKYSFANLQKSKFFPSSITLGKVIDGGKSYISQMFYYNIRESINGKAIYKKVSGLINLPKESGIYPIIVMIRGFVPKETYSTGMGTKRAGEVFAQNGFITVAPDFLGYAESDNSSQDSIEERFQTYTTTLSLLSSLDNLNSGLDASYSGRLRADPGSVGIWGHSNGGQIALSVLEITGKNYPAVLWAPVSKPFPYSIFFFMDEFEDHGKALRKVVADFENDYDIELYSPSNFYSLVNASIEIHQGTADDAVPLKWSDQLAADLKKLEKDMTYFTYPGADHNLLPSWNQAVQRSLDFYKRKLY